MMGAGDYLTSRPLCSAVAAVKYACVVLLFYSREGRTERGNNLLPPPPTPAHVVNRPEKREIDVKRFFLCFCCTYIEEGSTIVSDKRNDQVCMGVVASLRTASAALERLEEGRGGGGGGGLGAQ